MIGIYVFAAFSLIFCTLFCILRSTKANVTTLLLKTTASMCFVATAAFAINLTGSNSINLLILLGLVFGVIGDIMLDLKVMYEKDSDAYFVAGVSSFSLGHACYFVAALLHTTNVLPNLLAWILLAAIGAAILLTIIITFASLKMGMKFGKMFCKVIFYTVVLSFMLSFSIGIAIFDPIFWVFAAGIIMFILSDLVLSMQFFGGRSEKVWIYVNHITYYLAQILIALSLVALAI